MTVSAKMTLVILLLAILFAIGVHQLTVKVIHPLAVRLQDAEEALTGTFVESISGIKQVKIFNLEGFRFTLFEQSTHQRRMTSTKSGIFANLPKYAVHIGGGLVVIGGIIIVRLANPDASLSEIL